MSRRTSLFAGAATVALTTATMSAVAAAQAGRNSKPVSTGPPWLRPAATSCHVPPSLPGARVTVMLGDMGAAMMGGYSGGMMSGHSRTMLRAAPQTVPAGTVSVITFNHGSRVHELVVLPLAPRASIGSRVVHSDNTVDETSSAGEASNSCGAGSGGGIRPGDASWVTLDLKPGRYELICNLPGHYAAGMYAELDVT